MKITKYKTSIALKQKCRSVLQGTARPNTIHS